MDVYGEPPQGDPVQPALWRQIGSYAAYLVVWLAYAAVTLWLVFQLQVIVVAAAMGFRLNPWQVRALDLFAMTFFFFAWLIGVIVIEGYLRHGIDMGQLWRRSGRILLATSIMTAATVAIAWAVA